MMTNDTRKIKSELVSVTLILSVADAERLYRPVNGEGGYQSFLRQIQKQLLNDGTLTLTREQIDKIMQYAFRYGKDGGFQGRFQGIIHSLRELKIASQ